MSESEDKYEYRVFFHGELACPNRREHYKNTRSYEDMRKEYDLLNCDKITDIELMEIMLKTGRWAWSKQLYFLAF